MHEADLQRYANGQATLSEVLELAPTIASDTELQDRVKKMIHGDGRLQRMHLLLNRLGQEMNDVAGALQAATRRCS